MRGGGALDGFVDLGDRALDGVVVEVVDLAVGGMPAWMVEANTPSLMLSVETPRVGLERVGRFPLERDHGHVVAVGAAVAQRHLDQVGRGVGHRLAGRQVRTISLSSSTPHRPSEHSMMLVALLQRAAGR